MIEFKLLEIHRRVIVDELAKKDVSDLFVGKLAAFRVCAVIDELANLRVHCFGEIKSVFAIEHISDSAFSALAVDANDRFVAASDVLWIDREIGDAPGEMVAACFFDIFCPAIKALLDRILMASRKGGEYQFTRIRLALGHGESGRLFVDATSRRQVRKI